MGALSVDKVFRFVQFVANKESRGWVSPDEFNISAELAQIAVYSRLENYFLVNKKVHSDMRPFLSYATIADATPRVFPIDFRQLIGGRVIGSNIEVPELTQAELNPLLNSSFLAPSDAHPKCVVRNDGIQIYPSTMVTDISIEYVSKLSTAPLWNYTTASSRPIYDESGSIQFEFEDNLFQEIAMYILANIGMNLKEESVTQYGMAFNGQK